LFVDPLKFKSAKIDFRIKLCLTVVLINLLTVVYQNKPMHEWSTEDVLSRAQETFEVAGFTGESQTLHLEDISQQSDWEGA
jgi:hypothetical protein